MPKLHQRQDGELYILHNVNGSDDERAGIRHFGVSDYAAILLEQEGYSEGSSLPHELFYELLEGDHIWPGQVPQFSLSDVNAQKALSEAVAGYFTHLETGALRSEHAIETFRLDVLSQAILVRDAVLKKEMFIHIAQKLSEVQTMPGDPLEASVNELKSMLLRRTPPHLQQTVRVIFGPGFKPSHRHDGVSAGDASKPTQDASAAEGGSEPRRGDLRGFDSLSADQRDWVISCCSKFPGVTVQQTLDPATGEIHMVFAGLPVEMPQRLVDLILSRS